MLRSAALLTLLSALNAFLPEWRETRPTHHGQVAPSWLSRKSDHAWRSWTKELFAEAQKTVGRLESEFQVEYKRLTPGGTDSPEARPETMATGTYYGRLPEVFVDLTASAVFPQPLSPPARYSWIKTVAGTLRVGEELGKIDRELQSLRESHKALAPGEYARRTYELASRFEATAKKMSHLAQDIQYLDLWMPLLEGGENFNTARNLDKILTDRSPEFFGKLREQLRPRRVFPPAYLPNALPARGSNAGKFSEISLPITTDVTDKRFRREIEGALDTYWNDSGWARDRGVRFRIQWKDLPFDREFASGSIALENHLQRFPKNQAGLTSGGLKTHVRHHVLILGIERLHPRTLAHELGHLLGFGDCYLRTVTAQGPGGIFGLASLEWDNPVYPDDLMCDDQIGYPRAEVW